MEDNPLAGVSNQAAQWSNDFGQVVYSPQQHDGPVTLTTPTLAFTYAGGSANTVRPTGIIYLNGRTLSYDYGTAGGAAIGSPASPPSWMTTAPRWPRMSTWAWGRR